MNSPQNAGVSVVQIAGVRSLPPTEGVIECDFGSESLGYPNPFLAPARMLDLDRMKQTEHRVLARPLGRASRRRVTPMPRGNRLSRAELSPNVGDGRDQAAAV